MRATILSMGPEMLLRLDDGRHVLVSGYDGAVDYDWMTPEQFRRHALKRMGERERDRVRQLSAEAVIREKARDHRTMTPEEFDAKWYPTPLVEDMRSLVEDMRRDLNRAMFWGST